MQVLLATDWSPELRSFLPASRIKKIAALGTRMSQFILGLLFLRVVFIFLFIYLFIFLQPIEETIKTVKKQTNANFFDTKSKNSVLVRVFLTPRAACALRKKAYILTKSAKLCISCPALSFAHCWWISRDPLFFVR